MLRRPDRPLEATKTSIPNIELTCMRMCIRADPSKSGNITNNVWCRPAMHGYQPNLRAEKVTAEDGSPTQHALVVAQRR